MTNNNNYIIANWKMYGCINHLKSIKRVIKISKKTNFRKTKIIYCPPFTLLNSFHKLTNKTPLNVGAQNCHHNEFRTASSFTPLSPFLGMLKEISIVL